MRKESLPLVLAILSPLFIAVLLYLYFYGYDIVSFLKKIPILYVILLVPIALGFIVGIVKLARPY